MRRFLFAASAVCLAFTSVPAAALTFFIGQDDGVGSPGPYTNSRSAEAAFLNAAAAYGNVKTDGFEQAELGYYSPIQLPGVEIYTTGGDFGPDASGISNADTGALYGFNTTVGGSQWLGFPDLYFSSAIFLLEETSNSFGFYLTGIQSEMTANVTLQLLDGTGESYEIPRNFNGGVTYFGLVTDTPFSQVLISQTNAPGYADAFGIDDLSYNYGEALPAVPEPATWAMMIAGFGLVGVASRRRRMAAAA